MGIGYIYVIRNNVNNKGLYWSNESRFKNTDGITTVKKRWCQTTNTFAEQ